MAKAKYTAGKDGRFQTKVWDGTYNPDGRKHYIPIYSTKSSGDLEKKVNAMKAAVADRKYVTPTDETFLTYPSADVPAVRYRPHSHFQLVPLKDLTPEGTA